MSDDYKKRQNSEREVREFSERYFRDYSPIIPRHAQNSMPQMNEDDGTKETIRNRNSNIEES
ncbi:unknown [Brachyspira sp. CAG:484]|nr:unknown [Brachyspira sp. CAG:484]